MNSDKPTKTDQILDLLLDALSERQEARQEARQPLPPPQPEPEPEPALPEPEPLPSPAAVTAPAAEPPETAADWPPTIAKPEIEPEVVVEAWRTAALAEAEAETDWPAPATKPSRAEPLPSIRLDQMLRRLAVALALLIVLVNIPFNRTGLSLARAMPDARSLIIRDGLVLKGSGEEIYVLENNQKRWITTLEAFTFHGYRWEQVNVVDDAFLARFADGRPIYVLLKCQQSPHIYALENGQKRWIKDIPTFEREGFVWDDIKFVTCGELRQLPTGSPIPPDAGPSPEP
jgi:hypothetical protein